MVILRIKVTNLLLPIRCFSFFLLMRSWQQQTMKQTVMTRMTTPLTTDTSKAMRSPWSFGRGIPEKNRVGFTRYDGQLYIHKIICLHTSSGMDKVGYGNNNQAFSIYIRIIRMISLNKQCLPYSHRLAGSCSIEGRLHVGCMWFSHGQLAGSPPYTRTQAWSPQTSLCRAPRSMILVVGEAQKCTQVLEEHMDTGFEYFMC